MAAKKKKAQGSAAPASGESAASRLPFEPVQTRQKASKQEPSGTAKQPNKQPGKQPESLQSAKTKAVTVKPTVRSQGMPHPSDIPEVINRRMVSRAAAFCGIPSTLAVLTFVMSYLAVTNDIFKPPTTAVLLVSLGFFGLGVVGLSYGPLSASWDEERSGGWLGVAEFKLNFGRLRDSWRAAKAAQKKSDSESST